jgi:hypothetical protein
MSNDKNNKILNTQYIEFGDYNKFPHTPVAVGLQSKETPSK